MNFKVKMNKKKISEHIYNIFLHKKTLLIVINNKIVSYNNNEVKK